MENMQMKNLLSNSSDGMVWVESGKVMVKNAVGAGLPPIIKPCEGVKLIINGNEVSRLITVKESDKIELVALDILHEAKIDVEFSEDNLQAFVNYTPKTKIKYLIVDVPQANKIDIAVESGESEIFTIMKEELISKLKEKEVVFGLKDEVINEIVTGNKAGNYLIAEGTVVKDPVDDSYELYFNDNAEKPDISIIEKALSNVDFKDLISYVNVNEGDIVGKFFKCVAGEKGVDVRGTETLPREPKLLNIPEKDITINKETGEMAANKSGKIEKFVNGNMIKLTISTVLSVPEVNIHTGNVRFSGNVQVNGQVLEGMEMRAKGDMIINGSVNFASIYTSGSVSVRDGIISSKVNAGLLQGSICDPKEDIENMINEISNLIENINKMTTLLTKSDGKKESFPSIIENLLNSQNSNLPTVAYDLITHFKKGKYFMDEALETKIINCLRVFIGDYSEITSIEFLKNSIDILKELLTQEENAASKSDIVSGYLLNSTINALGNITITGKGIVNSDVYSKNGYIVVNGSVKGGELFAKTKIEVHEAGGELGTKILLAVPDDGTIFIRTIFPDVVVKVGKQQYKFLSKATGLHVKLVNRKLTFTT